ncbi:hypothetical protein DMUE_4556 [Dictyocoela muelleri]|nr:hypothetical protein DMUE_4556 [Dictyocoela muelleri]
MLPFYKKDLQSQIMLLVATYAYVDPSIEDQLKEKEQNNPLFNFLLDNSDEYKKIKSAIPEALSMDIDNYDPPDIIEKTMKIHYSLNDFINFKLVNLDVSDPNSPNVVYEKQSFNEIKSGLEPKKRIIKSELKVWIVEIPEYNIKPQFFEPNGKERDIGQLKESIKQKLGIPISKLHVVCGSRIMRNSEKIIKTFYQVKYKRK